MNNTHGDSIEIEFAVDHQSNGDVFKISRRDVHYNSLYNCFIRMKIVSGNVVIESDSGMPFSPPLTDTSKKNSCLSISGPILIAIGSQDNFPVSISKVKVNGVDLQDLRGSICFLIGNRDPPLALDQRSTLGTLQKTPLVVDDIIYNEPGSGSGCPDTDDECQVTPSSGYEDHLISPFISHTSKHQTTPESIPCDDEDCFSGSGSGEGSESIDGLDSATTDKDDFYWESTTASTTGQPQITISRATTPSTTVHVSTTAEPTTRTWTSVKTTDPSFDVQVASTTISTSSGSNEVSEFSNGLYSTTTDKIQYYWETTRRQPQMTNPRPTAKSTTVPSRFDIAHEAYQTSTPDYDSPYEEHDISPDYEDGVIEDYVTEDNIKPPAGVPPSVDEKHERNLLIPAISVGNVFNRN
ncbi:hypothetical protein NQ318_018616 [Aromia moschata]|uniref:Uncharacterized protein n=1 Tax=Aromia moschata TaxID=1265417 RepID=A0AAV8ZFF5_9CUCU|nr:hypothetical protein NQ318_018616 [Aromia moschata]